MDANINNQPNLDDEAALDAELEASIQSVRDGNALVPETPAPAKPVDKAPEVTPEPKPAGEETVTPPAEKKEGYEYRIPNKGKFESDEAYEKRVELLDLVKRRKLADTPEKKQALSNEIKATKSQLRNLNGNDKITNPLNTNTNPNPEPEDPSLAKDRERLKALGGVTKEEIEEIVRQEQVAQETKSTLNTFVGRHEELKDDDVRETFFDFVDANYAWQDKTGKELLTVLELAKEAMFKPSETIEERFIKGANVQEKVNAMQFPGGTNNKATYSPEMQKSINELKATGMSEEKALELLSD